VGRKRGRGTAQVIEKGEEEGRVEKR